MGMDGCELCTYLRTVLREKEVQISTQILCVIVCTSDYVLPTSAVKNSIYAMVSNRRSMKIGANLTAKAATNWY